jgi:hypothetical protein
VIDLFLGEGSVPGSLADVDQDRIGPHVSQKLVSYQPVVDDHIGAAEQLESANGDEARITGAAADQVNRAGLPARGPDTGWTGDGTHEARAKPRSRWRGVPPGQIDDDLDHAVVASDCVIHNYPRSSRLRAETMGDVGDDMRATADQERNHYHVREGRCLEQRFQWWIVVQKRREHLAGNAPPPQRFGELYGGAAAFRVPGGAMSHERERDRATVEGVLSHQFRRAPRHQRPDAGVASHRRCLPKPQLGMAPVTRERFRQNHIGVVPLTGEEWHHGRLVRRKLVQHAVEARLALVKGDGHFIVEPPGP